MRTLYAAVIHNEQQTDAYRAVESLLGAARRGGMSADVALATLKAIGANVASVDAFAEHAATLRAMAA